MAKSLFRDVLMVALFSVITRCLGFLFRIYLSRALSPQLLGVYHVALSVFMVLVLLVSSGIPVTVSKMTAKHSVQNNSKAINSVATSACLIGLFLSVFICLFIFAFQNLLAHVFTDQSCMTILLVLLPAVIFSAVYASLRGVFWGKKDYFTVGWTELLEQIAKILVFFVLFSIGFFQFDGAVCAGIAITVSCLVSCVAVVLVFLKKKGRFEQPKGFFKPVLKSSTPITGVRVISSLIQPLISVLFPLMLVFAGMKNETAMSLFGIAMGMTFPLLFLPSTVVGALSFALIPELSTAIEKGEKNLVSERIKTALSFSILISAFIIPVFVALGPEICDFLYANSLSGEFLIGASWVMIPIGLSNITSSILNAFNLEVKSFVNNLLGGVVLILCVVFLSASLQVYALVIGFGVCMSITSLLNILMIKKHTNLKLETLKPLLFSLMFCFPCAFLGKWTFGLLDLFLPNFLSIAFSSTLICASFILLCVVFRIVDFTFLFTKFPIFSKIFRKKRKI